MRFSIILSSLVALLFLTTLVGSNKTQAQGGEVRYYIDQRINRGYTVDLVPGVDKQYYKSEQQVHVVAWDTKNPNGQFTLHQLQFPNGCCVGGLHSSRIIKKLYFYISFQSMWMDPQ